MIELDDWQKEVMDYDGDILLCTGRRVGKTYVLARKACELMLKKPNTQIIVVSLTEDQAMLIISMSLNFLKERDVMKIDVDKKPTTKTITLTNGSRMISRPVGNAGEGLRGFEGSVLVVDEASRMPPLFWEAALPIILTQNGQIWMGSTPFGKKGFFWEKFNENYNKNVPETRFKVFTISTEAALEGRKISETWTEYQRDGVLRILKENRKDMTDKQFMQEHLGMFVDDILNFFEPELIEKCCILKRDFTRAGKRYLGVDVGRMYDPSAFADVVKVGDKVFQVNIEITRRTLTTETQNKIIDMAAQTPYKKIGIDAGSGALGVGIFDNLILTNIKNKIVAMNNRAVALDRDGKKKQTLQKEDFYNNMKAMMQNGSLLLLDDDEVKASLASVQWELTDDEDKTSRIRIYGSNTHVAEALIRAVYLAKEDKSLDIWCR